MPTQATREELHRVFVLMAWRSWSFEAALADPTRSALLHARAAQLRRRTQDLQPSTQFVRRFNPATGQWSTQTVGGPDKPALL